MELTAASVRKVEKKGHCGVKCTAGISHLNPPEAPALEPEPGNDVRAAVATQRVICATVPHTALPVPSICTGLPVRLPFRKNAAPSRNCFKMYLQGRGVVLDGL